MRDTEQKIFIGHNCSNVAYLMLRIHLKVFSKHIIANLFEMHRHPFPLYNFLLMPIFVQCPKNKPVLHFILLPCNLWLL